MDIRSNIPNTWKWVIINDIGVIVSGGTPSTKDPEFWGNEIAWITPADLSDHKGIYISKGNRSLSKIGLEFSSATLIPADSIIFSSRAPIGYVAISKNELATNQGFKNIILFKNLLNPKYVYYYLTIIKELAESMASGTTFLELSASKFKQIPFPLAPIEEQNRIVNKIEELNSELDKGLENLEKAKKQAQSSIISILKDLFTSNSENWINVPLSQLCEINYGKGLPQQDRIHGSILVYGSNGIIDKHNQALTKESSIIIGRKGSVGELNFSSNPCYPIDTTYFIEETEDFNLKFLYYQLHLKNLPSLNTATTIPGLNRDNLYGINISLPNNIEEQNLIVNKIEDRLSYINETAYLQ